MGSRKATKPVPREVLTQESSNSLVGAEQSYQLPGLPTWITHFYCRQIPHRGPVQGEHRLEYQHPPVGDFFSILSLFPNSTWIFMVYIWMTESDFILLTPNCPNAPCSIHFPGPCQAYEHPQWTIVSTWICAIAFFLSCILEMRKGKQLRNKTCSHLVLPQILTHACDPWRALSSAGTKLHSLPLALEGWELTFAYPLLLSRPSDQPALNGAFQQDATHDPLHQLLLSFWCQRPLRKKPAKNIWGTSELPEPMGLALFQACPSCIWLLNTGPCTSWFANVLQTAPIQALNRTLCHAGKTFYICTVNTQPCAICDYWAFEMWPEWLMECIFSFC